MLCLPTRVLLTSKVGGKVLALEIAEDGDMVWKRDIDTKTQITTTLLCSINLHYTIERMESKFHSADLKNSFQELKTRKESEDNMDIAKTTVQLLPYTIDDVYQIVTTVRAEPDGWICNICLAPKTIPKKQLRRHIGEHIIRSNQLYAGVCGFCGEKADCESWTERTSGKGKTKTIGVGSNCSKFIKFCYKSACTSTKCGPCTNRPVSCNEGNCVSAFIWTYNAEQHFAQFHKHTSIPPEWRVTPNEEKLMGENK